MPSFALNVPIILASTSPRRIELMKQVGLNVLVRSPDADEKPRRGELPKALVTRLAKEKARSVAEHAIREFAACIVIAADTIVVAPNGKTILNKPRDEAEARKMLSQLAGKTHTVFTGYCIHEVIREDIPRIITRVVESKVTMRKLNKADIAAYVATREPMDKAGSYAAQGLGMALIEKIRGSYTNVVGLPMTQLLADLENHFDLGLFSWVGRH